MKPNAGDVIGDYEILDVPGSEGGIYGVRQTVSGQIEAAKLLTLSPETGEDAAGRAAREIAGQAKLDHPNIASVRTAVCADDRLLIVMEPVEGEDLEALAQKGTIPLADGLRYIDQTLSALTYAHEQGVVHRDVSPANMMVTPEGTVKLTGFGVAKAAADLGLAGAGLPGSSPHYIPPERIQASSEPDARGDIYSLGVSLYELVTGKKPFDGGSEQAILSAHLETTPAPPAAANAEVPSGLSDVILMAIARDPRERFQSAKALQNALRGVTKGLAEPAPAPAPAPEPEPAPAAAPPPSEPVAEQKSRALLYVAAGVLGGLAILALAYTQIPKFWTAEGGANSTPSSESTAAPVAAAEDRAEMASEIAAEPEPVEQAAESVETPSAPTVAEDTDTALTQPPARAAAPEPERPAVRQRAAPAIASPAAAPVKRTQVQAQPATIAAPAAPAPAPPPPAPDEAALNELQERMILMATRIAAVNGGLENLTRDQSRMGLSLRGDMSSAHRTMEFRMDEAEAAIRSGDAASAKKNLDVAERELEKLERFLNL